MAGLSETLAALTQGRLSVDALQHEPGLLEPVTGFGANPGELTMWAYAPEDLAPGAALVVVLHGCTQTAEGYAGGAGWLELADRYGFAVLCPQQERSNNPNLCFNWFQPGDIARGQGEAASIREMIAHMVQMHGLDAQRVFVTGLSAGAAMANVMLATYPEVFAAGALVAGLPYGSASNVMEAMTAMRGRTNHTPEALGAKIRAAGSHRGPWPKVSVWQGDQDATVLPGVAEDVAAQWVDVHEAPVQRELGEGAGEGRRHLAWSDAAGETVVELHWIGGMGHGAPICAAGTEGCGTAGPYLLEVGVSSSFEIAERWGLTAARRKDRARRAAPAAAPAYSAAPSAGLPLDVKAVIANALRDAGLMR